MNIAFLTGQFPSLSETFILNQITGLIDLGHRVTIFTERTPPERARHEAIAARGLVPHRVEALPDKPVERFLRLPSVWRWDRAHLRALDVLRFGLQAASLRLLWGAHLFDGRREFDVIQCHFGPVGLKAALLRRAGAVRGALVTAFHGEDIINYPKRFRPGLYRPLFAEGALFLPISARWNDELAAQGCPPERIRVHRMGIDPDGFASAPRARGDGPLRLLTVGRLVEKKGVADALRAIAAARARCEYVIAGDGPLRASLEMLAGELGLAGCVRFEGEVTQAQVARLLAWADAFLLPSVTAGDGDIEGIPVCIMEAMARRLPVLSTRHSGIPELVADGVSGLLAPERDVAALARALDTLAADPELRARMGEAGRAIVERDYNIHKLNLRLESYYREITGS